MHTELIHVQVDTQIHSYHMTPESVSCTKCESQRVRSRSAYFTVIDATVQKYKGTMRLEVTRRQAAIFRYFIQVFAH